MEFDHSLPFYQIATIGVALGEDYTGSADALTTDPRLCGRGHASPFIFHSLYFVEVPYEPRSPFCCFYPAHYALDDGQRPRALLGALWAIRAVMDTPPAAVLTGSASATATPNARTTPILKSMSVLSV
jgi:hypothetical protein